MESEELTETPPAAAAQEPAPAWIGIGLDLIFLAILLVAWQVLAVPTVVFVAVFAIGWFLERRVRQAATACVARRRPRRRAPTAS